MNLLNRALLTSIIVLAAAPALAQGKSKNLIPLERGIYEDVEIPCKQRSNASAKSFWGDKLNNSRTECKITKLKVEGNVYSFTGDCADITDEDSRYTLAHQVTVKDKKSFTLKTEDGTTDYRWCAYKMFD